MPNRSPKSAGSGEVPRPNPGPEETTRRRPVIGVMGAAQASSRTLAAAHELGRLLAERGWIVLTGARPVGVMAAACAGAKEVPDSLTLGIVPGSEGGLDPNVDVAVFTGMGDARNVINVLTSDVVVACGVEGPGTASEVSLGLKSGKPVILLAASDSARAFFGSIARSCRLLTADVAEDAVRIIEKELAIRRWSP
jgi:uncharacterized protein (TIGR00725 family)